MSDEIRSHSFSHQSTSNNSNSNTTANNNTIHNLIQLNPLLHPHNQGYQSDTLSVSSTTNSQSSSPTLTAYSSLENSQCSNSSNYWQKLSECDEFIGPKRSKHTMVTHGNFLYVFGGDNGKNMLNDLVTYDCTNNSWGRALNSSPPTPRYHHSAVIYNNSMFVFGGYTGDLNSNTNLCNKNDLIEYRISSGVWINWNTETVPMPVPRAAHGAVVYDHKMIIFAGYDGNSRLNDMWYIPLNTPYNASKIWTEIEQFGDQPSTVCNFPLVVVQDSMYLFSGQSGAKTSNLLFKFDFKTSSWSKISSNFILRGTNNPPERRSGHIMIAHQNHLYIYGGVLGNSFFHDVYSFDLETKSWDLITMHHRSPIPSGRSFLAGIVYDQSLYVFGGNGDQNTRSNELYKLKLPTQPKSTLKNDFYNMLKKDLCSDLEFICADKQIIKAHCAILAARSPHCRHLIKQAKERLCINNNVAMRKNSSNANNPASINSIDESKAIMMSMIITQPPFLIPSDKCIQIKLNDEKSEAVKIVLEFLYTDRIISLEGNENEFETIKLMSDVYKLANQFMIPKLKKLCENFIDSSITCANVLSLLRYVDSLNLSLLKELCMKFLSKDSNFNQVIMLTEFEQLQPSLMVEIIRLRQQQRKSTNADQMSELILSKSLEDDMENFLKKDVGNEFADILIILNENSPPILAHRCILAARCSYFEAYFRSFMPKEGKIMMTIGNTIPPRQSCLALLKYIYYDDVHNIQTRDALYLFSASHYFQFSNLRLYVFCKQNLEANVSKDNVFDILEMADKIKDDYMKKFSLKIIRTNLSDLTNYRHRISKLPRELLVEIIMDLSNSSVKSSSSLGPNSSHHLTISSSITSSSSGLVYNHNLPSPSSLQQHYQSISLNEDSLSQK